MKAVMDQKDYLSFNWSSVESYSKAKRMPYTERFDPVYGIQPSGFVYAAWERPEVEVSNPYLLPSGRVEMGKRFQFSPVGLNRSYVNSDPIITLLSSLFQFGVATTEQLISVTQLKQVPEYLLRLQEMGLVARAVKSQNIPVDIWCFDWSKKVVLDWISGLDPVSKLLLTGGRDIVGSPPGATSSSAIRHTILMNELLIRICESSDKIVGFWGEPFLEGSDFYKASNDEMSRSTAADGAVVTNTGKIIAFEFVGGAMSGSNARRTVDKAAAWAAVIGLTELDLSVIFVHGDNDRSNWTRMNQAIYQGTTVELNRFITDKADANHAADKIGLTSLHRLCPEVNRVSADMINLNAWSPRRNEVYSFLEDDKRRKWADERASVIMNTSAALHTPPWVMV